MVDSEFRQMSSHLQSLQDQVNSLFSSLTDLQSKSSVPPVAGFAADANGIVDGQPFAFPSSPPRRDSESHQNAPGRAFSGPATSTFYIDQTGAGVRSGSTPDPSKIGFGSTTPVNVREERTTSDIPNDPMWEITLDEALRLCKVYDDNIGSSYPIVDVEKATLKARTMFTFLESMRRVGLMEDESKRGDSFCGSETLVLKLMLALASTAENHGVTELGQRLFENVRLIVADQDLMGGPATILGLQLFTLIVNSSCAYR